MDSARRLVIVLLLASCLAASSEGRTLIVEQGDTGNFKTVRSAIAFSSSGDEIIVRPGSYRESVVLNKSIVVKGEPGVRIDGMGKTIFQVAAPNCAIYNLTLVGSRDRPGVILESGENLVRGCTFQDCYTGVEASAVNNTVENCKISSSAYALKITSGVGSRVFGNIINGGMGYGIFLEGCGESSVLENDVKDCSSAVDLVRSNQSLVSNNTLKSSNVGVRVMGSSENLVSNNTLSGNRIAGVYLEGSLDNEIEGNFLEGNGNGIHLKGSRENLVRGNNASDNRYGITLKGSWDNVLRNNSLAKNQYNLRVEPGDMSDLTLIASATTSFEGAYIHDIDSSNTAEGKPVCYLIASADTSITESCGFVALIDCVNVSVLNQIITNSSVGILLVNSTGCKVQRCALSSSEVGVSLLDSDGCSVLDTLAEFCNRGFWVAKTTDALLDDDVARACTESGFRLEGDRRIILKDSKASASVTGISLLDSFSSHILSCNARENGDDGIRLIRSHRCTLTGNYASENKWGIKISGSNGCVVSRNNASLNDQVGLSMEQLTGAEVYTNVAKGNQQGIFLQSAKDVRLEDNELTLNSRYGLRMSVSTNCNLTKNRFMHNSLVGLSLTDCNDNVIYNNDFVENGGLMSNNAVDNGANQWDLGPVVGGNYWSDHKVEGNPSNTPRKITSKGLDRYPFQDPGGWL